MKIAVIGSGIAGLSAAWLLSREGKHEVTIYEKSGSLGMDAHGIDLPSELRVSGQEAAEAIRLDMPLRVFTESYYPNLTSLYEEVGVKFKPEDYSGSFSSLAGDSYFAYRNLLVGSLSLPYALPVRARVWSVAFWRLTKDLLRWLITSRVHVQNGRLNQSKEGKHIPLTLAQYLKEEKYSQEFIDRFLLPSLAAICTCSYTAMLQYPAHLVLHYLVTRSMKGVRRAQGGAKAVVDKLSEHLYEIRLNARVESIIPTTGGKVIVTEEKGIQLFDHVVMCTQANQALPLLPTISKPLYDSLSAIPYEKSGLVLHTDERLMPKNKYDWKSVNFIMAGNSPNSDLDLATKRTQQQKRGSLVKDEVPARDVRTEMRTEAMATIWMNRVQPRPTLARANIFQSWNPIMEPREGTVLCRGEFERPVVTFESLAALETLWQLQGKDGLHFCGSYSLPGIPLLETGVSSAVRIAQSLGCECPWKAKLSRPEYENASPINMMKKQRQKSRASLMKMIVLVLALVALVLALVYRF